MQHKFIHLLSFLLHTITLGMPNIIEHTDMTEYPEYCLKLSKRVAKAA
ncbi:hypothetical protein [Marinilabilia sp.]|nr:hypothetical protein [Marinilabilia sp.]